jgi:hypothetical protein
MGSGFDWVWFRLNSRAFAMILGIGRMVYFVCGFNILE